MGAKIAVPLALDALKNDDRLVFVELKKRLLEEEFSLVFIESGGMSELIRLVKEAKGNLLAAVLAVLPLAMNYAEWSILEEDVVSKIVEGITSPKSNIKSNALALMNGYGSSGGDSVRVLNNALLDLTAGSSSGSAARPYEALVNALVESADLNVRANALSVVTTLISSAQSEEARTTITSSLADLDFSTKLKAFVMDQGSGFGESPEVLDYMTAMLAPMQKLLLESFSFDNAEHIEKLTMLWHTCFPTEELEGQVTGQWKKFGFANTDPSSDMGRTGVFGLHCLHYLCCRDPAEFGALIQSQQTRADRDYPLAAAAMAMADLVAREFRLKFNVHDVAPAILLDHANALQEIFCVCFNVTDTIWRSLGGEFIDYPMVIAICKKTLSDVLQRNPTSVDTFARSAAQAVTQLKAKYGGSIEETFLSMGLTADVADNEATLALKEELLVEMIPVVKLQYQAALKSGLSVQVPPVGKAKQAIPVRLELNSLGSVLIFSPVDAASPFQTVQIPVGSIVEIMLGSQCPVHQDPKKACPLDTNLTIGLLLNINIGSENEMNIQFAPHDRRSYTTILEGIRSLTGKDLAEAASMGDAEKLAELEMRVRLIELEGDVSVPPAPPALPPPPPTFSFVVPDADIVGLGTSQPFRVP